MYKVKSIHSNVNVSVLVKMQRKQKSSFLCVKIVILHSDLDAAWMVDTAAVHIGVMDALKFHI